MKNVTVICDRCGKVVQGIVDESNMGKFTGGFYDVSHGEWSKYARWEETIVCDACMHSDPAYKKRYGIS